VRLGVDSFQEVVSVDHGRVHQTNHIDEEWLSELVRDFPGAQAAIKLEWDVFVLTVGGKIFGFFGDVSGRTLLTVKGDPLENEALRQEFPEVTPGYHVNKQHWVSIPVAETS
jgi:predicted DNA-binding protein (MmcQ/YjbR family)